MYVVLSHSVMSDSLRPHGLQPTRLLCSWGFFRQGYWSGYPGDLPNPGIKPRSPTLQADSLLTKPPGKPQNTGVGSLSLLQGIFPTQELNQGLLHCRWILYQLSYQESPQACISVFKYQQGKSKCGSYRLFILFCVSRWVSACVLLKKDNDNGFLGTGNNQCFSFSLFLIFQVFYKECVNTLL